MTSRKLIKTNSQKSTPKPRLLLHNTSSREKLNFDQSFLSDFEADIGEIEEVVVERAKNAFENLGFSPISSVSGVSSSTTCSSDGDSRSSDLSDVSFYSFTTTSSGSSSNSNKSTKSTRKCRSCDFTTERLSTIKHHVNMHKKVKIRKRPSKRVFYPTLKRLFQLKMEGLNKSNSLVGKDENLISDEILGCDEEQKKEIQSIATKKPLKYSCNSCNFSAKCLGPLKSHFKIHDKNRQNDGKFKFGCQFCGARFAVEERMKAHERRDH